MKKYLFLIHILGLFVVNKGFAQSLYIRDYNGRIINPQLYTDVKGSPYFADSWHKGYIKLSNGQTYKDIELKFDDLKGQVLYKQAGQDEVIMTFSDPIDEFLITNVGTGSTPDAYFVRDKKSNGLQGSVFYEVLYNGGIKLLKRNKKFLSEQTQYNSATKIAAIDSKAIYYLMKADGNISEIKKDKRSVLLALAEKKDTLETYINTNKLDLKRDADLINLIEYYNKL